MVGRIKYVCRKVWIKNQECNGDYGIVAMRNTATCAVLYNHNEVEIDEDSIRNYYKTMHLTASVISALSKKLRNVYIDYNADENGGYHLDGCLHEYLDC